MYFVTVLFDVKSSQSRLGDQQAYYTRNGYNLMCDVQHLSLFEKKPSNRGDGFYNCLPEDLKRMLVRKLKTSQADLLLNSSIYSPPKIFLINWRNLTYVSSKIPFFCLFVVFVCNNLLPLSFLLFLYGINLRNIKFGITLYSLCTSIL